MRKPWNGNIGMKDDIKWSNVHDLREPVFFRFFGRLNSVYETVCVCVCEINQCSNLTIDRDSKTDMYNIK